MTKIAAVSVGAEFDMHTQLLVAEDSTCKNDIGFR
jgi:hypothetical protein